MEQMNVDDTMKVSIDLNEETLPKSAGILQPLIYLEGKQYYCVLGPNKTAGIWGIGTSPTHSIIDWDVNLTSRLATPLEDDEVIKYVKDVYNAYHTEVW